MTKEEFQDWKHHSVTMEIYSLIEDLIEEGRDELEASAGQDSVSDARRVGKLAGLRTLLDVSYQEEKND